MARPSGIPQKQLVPRAPVSSGNREKFYGYVLPELCEKARASGGDLRLQLGGPPAGPLSQRRHAPGHRRRLARPRKEIVVIRRSATPVLPAAIGYRDVPPGVVRVWDSPLQVRSPGQIPREPGSGPRSVTFPASNCSFRASSTQKPPWARPSAYSRRQSLSRAILCEPRPRGLLVALHDLLAAFGAGRSSRQELRARASGPAGGGRFGKDEDGMRG